MTSGVTYSPSPFAVNVPVQTGVPLQSIAATDGYGPYSCTETGSSSTPMPETATVSEIASPGAESCELTCVTTFGVPVATVVSAVSEHAVVTPLTRSLEAMLSW